MVPKYFSGGFFLNAPSVISTIITLVTLPIILANLPIDHYGKWQFVIALQTWLVVFSAANITLASKKGIAQGLNGTFLYAFWARFRLLIVVSIIVFLASLFLKISGQHTFAALLLIIGLYLLFGYLPQISFFEFLIAKKKFKEWCSWHILLSSIAMIGSALVAFITKDIIYFALFQLGSSSVLSWIGWYRIVKRENLIASYKRREIDKECVPFGIKLIPAGAITITANKISHFIIGPFFGFANLAIFSLADNLRNQSASIIKSTRPLLYADFAKIESEVLTRIISRRLIRIGILSILLTSVFILAGWFYIRIFLPVAFHQAIIYFSIIAIGLPAGTLTMILHTALESHLRYKELTVTGIIPNLLKIILILILGYFWQLTGICIALAISAWVSFGFYYLLTVRRDLAVGIIEEFPFLEEFISKI